MVDDQRAPLNGQQPKQSWFEKFAVWIVFTIFVTFRALDRVFLKGVTNALSNPTYTLIWSNLLWPFFIQIMTLCMLMGYIVVLRQQGHKQYNLKFFMPGNPQASSMGPVPLYQMALFSLGDQLNAALSAPPSPFVTQPIQSVMTNGVLIWMAVIAFFWIGARFKQVHYVGISLIIMSILVQLSAKLKNDCSEAGIQAQLCFTAYEDATGHTQTLSVGLMTTWYILFFVSTLPAAAGNVYKQKVLQGRDVDVCYATWWSGNFQVVWGWLCLPLIWIHWPAQKVNYPGQTFSAIGDTLSCIAGNVPNQGDDTCATSPPPWFWIILYLCFNISFNMCLLWLTKRMSAAWAQIATVLCLNLCSFFSQFKFLMGGGATPMTLNDWLGTILASIALWVYNLESETTVDGINAQQATGSFVADGPVSSIIERAGGGKGGGSFVRQDRVAQKTHELH